MAEIYCRQQPENPKDWEKKRLATVKRLNKVNVKGRCVQPQGWTLQDYLLEWHEPEWRLQSLQYPVRSVEDRLRYAAEHEWNTVALHANVLACVSEQLC